MICGRIIAPSLLGKVDFALQEAKDGRVIFRAIIFLLTPLCNISA